MMLSRALMMEIGRPPAEHAATGRHAEAEALFRQALAAEVYAGSVAEVPDSVEIEAEGRLFDAGINLELARLFLDQGLLEEARAAVGLLALSWLFSMHRSRR